MQPEPSEQPWSHPVTVASLPLEGQEFELVPDEATRKALAKVAEVLAVLSLKATLTVRPTAAGGAEVTGKLDGVVRQACVVSLDDFESTIAETIAVDFADNPEPAADSADEGEGEDLPDPIIDGQIDLGALATEFLILAVDPYPRKPGVAFSPPEISEDAPQPKRSPFEQLSGLKDRIKK